MRRLALGLLLLCTPLVGCNDLSEKRAELQRTENELHTVTYETEQLRLKLPAVMRLEEENQGLRHQVLRLALEVDALRKRTADRDAHIAAAKANKARRAAAAKKNARQTVHSPGTSAQ